MVNVPQLGVNPGDPFFQKDLREQRLNVRTTLISLKQMAAC